MSYLDGEFLIKLMLAEGSILISCHVIMSYLGGEFLMELMLFEGSILTSW